MKKIALLTLLLINLSLSFSLPRNQASPAIFSVTKTNNSILFRHTDSTLTAIPCQSVASIVSNADPSKIVSVWVVQQGDYDKIMQFDYSVCGFSSKSDAVDSLTAWAICDTSSGGGGGGGISQSTLDDSILTLRSIRKVDTSYTFRNSTLDSLCQITVINGISYRSCGKDSVGAGSSTLALDKISDAVDTNTINNGNFQQEWQWNSLTSGIGLNLSSTSTGATSNTQTIMSINQSGANANANQSTYGLKISNSKTGTSNINYGLDVSCTGAPTNGNVAINADGRVYISNGSLQFRTTGYGIYFAENSFGNNIINFAAPAVNSLQINSGANINLNAVNGRGVSFGEPNERFYNFSTVTGVRSVFLMGAELLAGTYYSFATGTCGIERNGASLRLSANVTGGGAATYTPNDLLTVYGTNSNVGIGTTTPVASAILEVSSTTSGFLPPRMTATQASAISSPAKGLMLYSTDTNGTFTSAGWWGYNGTIWKLILAE